MKQRQKKEKRKKKDEENKVEYIIIFIFFFLERYFGSWTQISREILKVCKFSLLHTL